MFTVDVKQQYNNITVEESTGIQWVKGMYWLRAISFLEELISTWKGGKNECIFIHFKKNALKYFKMQKKKCKKKKKKKNAKKKKKNAKKKKKKKKKKKMQKKKKKNAKKICKKKKYSSLA